MTHFVSLSQGSQSWASLKTVLVSYILSSFQVDYGELESVGPVTVSCPEEEVYWFDFGFYLYSNNLFILNM